METIKIPNATKVGYLVCIAPGAFDMTYPSSRNRRGRVQEFGSVSPTICAGGDIMVFLGYG